MARSRANPLDRALEAFADELAEASRAILNAAGAAAPAVEMKEDASPVTAADRRVEETLRSMIAERFPAHGILGEEHGSTSPDAEYVWVIDPIDGTLAFVAGVPVFGTLIGLAHEGRPLLGVIDHPRTADRWVGGPGRPTTWNRAPVRVRTGRGLAEAFLTTSNPDLFSAPERRAFDRLRSAVQMTLYGASCYAYGLLASGRTDIGIDGGFDIFDMLAPAAVIQGAGGVVTDWQGGAITLAWRGRVIAAGDPQLHRAALARVGDVPFSSEFD